MYIKNSKSTSPLEQFIIYPKIIITFFSSNLLIDLSITNFFFTLLTIIIIFCFNIILFTSLNEIKLIDKPLQFIFKLIQKFLMDIILAQVGKLGVRYFNLYLLIFYLIFLSNVLGLVPFCFTVTSHIILVSFLAFIMNIAFIIIGFHKKKISFLKQFIPTSGPLILRPLIAIIEIISYLLRTFSLAIRLFANMLAGHILLVILAGFIIKFVNLGLGFFAFFPLMIMICVFFLELGICCIQAYVFLTLLSIYLADSVNSTTEH